MKTPIEVKVGDLWADNDWRARGRVLQVASVTDSHATCVVVANAPYSSSIGKLTRVRLDRFRPTSTGYRRVATVADAAVDEANRA